MNVLKVNVIYLKKNYICLKKTNRFFYYKNDSIQDVDFSIIFLFML